MTFYFIFDTTRRRVIHLTLIVCTLGIGVGSELIQGILPNGRRFDPFDIVANIVGSLAAVGLAGCYHKRSAERRRRAKYSSLAGNTGDGGEDLELGEGSGVRTASGVVNEQESGVISASRTVEEELDNWDENAEDDVWDDDATTGGSAGTKMTPASSAAGDEDVSKKTAAD